MIRLCGFTFWLIAGILLSAPGLGCAQFVPIELRDGRVAPTSNDRIRLDSKEMIIRLYPCSYTVDAHLKLFNSGDETTEWIGIQQVPQGQFWIDFPRYHFVRFHVRMDGSSVDFTEKRDPDRSALDSPQMLGPEFDHFKARWLIRPITFRGHSRTTVRITYEACYRYSGGYHVVNYGLWIDGFWKDKIRKAVLVIDGTAIGGADKVGLSCRRHPNTERRISDHLVKYEIKDYEPEPLDGLRVSFRPSDGLRSCAPNVFNLRDMKSPRARHEGGR